MGQWGQNCGLTFPLTFKFGGEGKVLKRGELLLSTQVVLNVTQVPTSLQECSLIQIMPNVLFTHRPFRSRACVRYTHSDSCYRPGRNEVVL